MNTLKTMEKINRNATQHSAEPVDCSGIEVGDIVRQGDLYLIYLAPDIAAPPLNKTDDRQLAPGNTQGSRHIAAAPARVYLGQEHVDGVPRQLLGPMVVSDQMWSLLHPEHSDLINLPAGSWQCWYQRDLMAEEEEVRRVQD